MNGDNKFKRFPLVNAANEELAKITLEHLWADVFALKIKVLKTEAVPKLSGIIREVLEESNGFKARSVLFRLIKGEMAGEEIVDVLAKLGFEKKSERIEFKKNVNELPSDDESPLAWKTAEELDLKPQDIAAFLKQVAEGDPDTDPIDDPMLFIQDFLEDPILTSGLQCIHFGFIGDEVAALAVIQIDPKTGWSRISYMGVIPKFRKQNLGLWVHRYSFKVMKAEGGKIYHGGAISTNTGMIRLFEKNGCSRSCEMKKKNWRSQGLAPKVRKQKVIP